MYVSDIDFNHFILFLLLFNGLIYAIYIDIVQVAYQSINQFICPEMQQTGHQRRMQPLLTGARKNDVSKNNK